jgi:hypothetical protein
MAKNVVNLEELERAVMGLEHHIDEVDAAMANVIDNLENVKKMTLLLIKQRDDLEKKSKK